MGMFCRRGAAAFAVVIAVCVACVSCARADLSVTSWNVQTFFDAETVGTEYSEFARAGGSWTREAYRARLVRLCGAIQAIGSDVFVMEEIENEGVVYDIFNELEGRLPPGRRYRYACFCAGKGGSIGNALISRYPIRAVSSHDLAVRSEADAMPSMRPAMRVTVEKDGNALDIIVLHWKSKSGGAEKSEVWRLWQEAVLADLLASGSNPALVCGDLNKDIKEFAAHDSAVPHGENIALSLLRGDSPAEAVPVHSPWILHDGQLVEPGSYNFNARWERIDHFFAKSVVIKSFRPESSGEWVTGSGLPFAFRLWTGSGYSDHLPITCTVGL